MILINLLPHREARREQKKKDFANATAVAAFVGVVIGGLWYGVVEQQLSDQRALNDRITTENEKLDKKIEEVRNLESEIYALKLRRDAVERLQTDRNVPTHLLSELVEYTPDGVRLLTLKQTDTVVAITGLAQTNERISIFLNNFSTKTAWLKKPELIEIQAVSDNKAKDSVKTFKFSVNLILKNPETIGDSVKPAASSAASATS